jgi:conjugal transfer pilus assembly protein TraB
LRLPTPAGAADKTRNKKALQIRLVAAEQTAEEGEETLPEDAVLIPAGSILRGVLLSGMDAPTGRQSRRDPYPALARIKHDAILPNGFRADVRGRVVSKQGTLIAQAMMASFVEGFSKMFSTVPVATLSTSTGQSTPFQNVMTPQALQGAAVSGAGNALDRLANFFMDMAEEMFPVIEIDAGALR